MNLCLFDGRAHRDLLPLSFTRPVSELRVGLRTIREKWEGIWDEEVGIYTLSYLANKFPNADWDEMIFLSAAVCPHPQLTETLRSLKVGQKVNWNNRTIAFASSRQTYESCELEQFEIIQLNADDLSVLGNPGDIFELNDRELRRDIENGKKNAQRLDQFGDNKVIGDQLYVEEGAKASNCIFNTQTGPVYLSRNSEMLEGSVIRGSFVLCEGAVVKMAAKIYGATTIGPYSKVGGELSNVVIQGYSNKGHDGFLGNSVLGEWCNLGADTNTSNLKNNYSEIKVWDYGSEGLVNTGRQFQGLIMGDHSKTGINTMLNTGTTIGVSSNVFGGGFPPKFIPSFSWGGKDGFATFNKDKSFELAERVMERRNLSFSDLDKEILSHIFKLTEKYRT